MGTRGLWALTLAFTMLLTAGRAQSGTSSPQYPGGEMELSLKQAVEIALGSDGSSDVLLSVEHTKQVMARMFQDRAPLLPSLGGSITQQNQTRNLAAFGIRIVIPIPGYTSPVKAPPFQTFDARLTLSQSLFDFSAIRRYQASRSNAEAAKKDTEYTYGLTARQVARAYTQALAAEARLEAAKANVDLAESLVKLAQDQKAAGGGTGLDVTRAQVQLANEKQGLLVAETTRTEAHLNLLHSMGARLDTKLRLTDILQYKPVDPLTMDQAITQALQNRPDLKAQQKREDGAKLMSSAVKMERMPSITGFGDYGTIGSSLNNNFSTRTYGVSIRIPIFDGGRIDARRAESEIVLRQESIKTRDHRDQIELEVRVAMERLKSAEQQMKVSEEGLNLAETELGHARRRFQAGVAGSLEVTDAQTRLERARENRISALAAFNVARIDLGLAMGNVRKYID